MSPLSAKTEIDKAFKKRDPSNLSYKVFSLYSPNIYENQQIRKDQVFDDFGCNGMNISPKLVWRNAPSNTKSFAVTMFDKDAKTGSGWWHWVVYNIPADVDVIDEGVSGNKKLLPKGVVEGINDYGIKEYGGVCLTDGEMHNYVITVYALKVGKLNLSRRATPAMVNLYLNKFKIKTATIEAFYSGADENKIDNQNKQYKLNKLGVSKKIDKNVVVEE